MLNVESILLRARNVCSPWAKSVQAPESNRLDIMLDVADLLPATRALLEARWGYLSAITGLDAGASANELEVLYHWCSGPVVLTFRLRTARDLASVPTLCEILPAASFFERELSEMFGVTVVGAPNPARLFLPDDWPSGVYPLRKDYNAGGA